MERREYFRFPEGVSVQRVLITSKNTKIMTGFSLRSIRLLAILIILGVQLHAGPYYVVIASFSGDSAARKFQTSAKAVFNGATVKFDPARRLYHLHVMESARFEEAEKFLRHLKIQNGFEHAWIHTDFKAGNNGAYDSSSGSPVRLELYTGQTVLLSSTDNSHFGISKAVGERQKTEQNLQLPFTFTAKTRTGVSIPGQVALMTEDGHVISECKTNEIVYFSGQYARQILTVVFRAPGFNSETRAINFSTLEKMRDCYQHDDGAWEVLFRVSKTKTDAISLVYKKTFHDDAAVLRPESKDAIDKLVLMAKSAPGCRIVINTHCNAGGKRPIKLAGNDCFQISEAEERSGSDKLLTRERAKVLQAYLVRQGIEASRISVFGWGSLDLLVKGDEKHALNERVELALTTGEQ